MYAGDNRLGRVLSADKVHNIANHFHKDVNVIVELRGAGKAQEIRNGAAAGDDIHGNRIGIHLHDRDDGWF